jgi:hypothetical protein
MVRWGRRAGKTLLGTSECIQTASQGGHSWWVAPSYKIAQPAWRQVYRWGRVIPNLDISKTDKTIYFTNGGWMAIRSADDPQSLRGEGLDLVVLDEAPYMKEEAWVESIWSALADRLGRALFIYTPRGRNWVYRLEMQALQDPDWATFQGPSWINPHLQRDEMERLKARMPERIYRQEILAEYIAGGGDVFRFVSDAAVLQAQSEPKKNHTYVMGIDWGRFHDFTVAIVLDVTASPVEMVYMDRFTGINYELQLGRLREIRKKWDPIAITPEANSMGSPLVEQLVGEGWPIYPFAGFQTTHVSKQQIIDGLSLAFEKGRIHLIDDPMIIAELESFEETTTPTGRITYKAPEGMTDDIVMALALAWSNVDVYEGPIAQAL